MEAQSNYSLKTSLTQYKKYFIDCCILEYCVSDELLEFFSTKPKLDSVSRLKTKLSKTLSRCAFRLSSWVQSDWIQSSNHQIITRNKSSAYCFRAGFEFNTLSTKQFSTELYVTQAIYFYSALKKWFLIHFPNLQASSHVTRWFFLIRSIWVSISPWIRF